MPMAARADFSEKYLTPESGLPKAHNLSSVLAFSNGQCPVASKARLWTLAISPKTPLAHARGSR